MFMFSPDEDEDDEEVEEDVGLMEAKTRPMDLPLCFSVLFQLWLAARPLCIVVVVQCCRKICDIQGSSLEFKTVSMHGMPM